MRSLADEVGSRGYAIVPGVLDSDEVGSLIEALQDERIVRSTRGEATFGARNLLQVKAIADLTTGGMVRDLIEPILGSDAIAVRAVFFDKTPGANWPVAWHQDLSIELANSAELDEWTHWRTKGPVRLVQPPPALLEHMVAVRIHLDDCGSDNGALKVVGGSHREGRLSRTRMSELRGSTGETVCASPLGSVMLMRPLLLHASSPAVNPRHRRVIHIDFAGAGVLPAGLRWARS